MDDARWQAFESKQTAVEAELKRLKHSCVQADDVAPELAEELFGEPLRHEYMAYDLLRRPGVDYAALHRIAKLGAAHADPGVAEQVDIEASYAGYIERQEAEITRQKSLENTKIPADIDYSAVKGLSIEVCQKLAKAQPESIAQASRLEGLTPAAISILLIHLRRSGHQLARSA